MTCSRCGKEPIIAFHGGKRAARCGCFGDYRTPIEIRRDAVLNKYGDDPDAYTPAVLAELARDGLFDVTASFCPAGRLSMAETKAREAAQAGEAGTAETTGSARRASTRSAKPMRQMEGGDET